MALVLNERVKETTTTTGTGALSLGGASDGFETFAAGIGNSNTTYYAIFHLTANEFEVGLGTLDSDSSDLTRTTIYASSNSDSAVNFSAGTKTVFCTMPAARSVFLDADGDVTLGANLDVGGNLVVTGTTTFNGGTLTLGDANTDNIVFGGEVDSNIIPDDDNTYDLGSSSKEWKDLYIDGVAYVDAINFAGTAISATAAELNIMDGVTSTAAELNILDGVTSTAAELNILDGVTSTAAELNILDGVTSTAAELNYSDTGASVGTVVASKVVTADANKDVASFRNITLTGELDAGSLDVSGDADIDGTLEADAITVNGTALASVIAGTTVTLASTVTVTDSTANTNFPVVFHDESNTLLDDTGALRYNPSTGELLVPKLTVAGTTTTVDTVTMNAANAVIFEGATADSHETTLTIIDPTSDRTINLPNVSGTIPVLAAASTTQITSTPEELNILDGVTSTAAELNLVDGITAGTVSASLAVIVDSNKDITGFRNVTTTGVLTANAGVVVDELTIDADTITATDDFIIDAAADITLDAAGNQINFKNAGTTRVIFELDATPEVSFYGGNLAFNNLTQDADIAFKGFDGSSFITALNLDMSDAGTATFNHDIVLGDNSKAIFGAGSDLEIYHDASDSYIKDSGTGLLFIRGSSGVRIQGANGEAMVHAAENGAVELYHDNVKKFETASGGVSVTGEVAAATLDISGDADIDGTLEADAITINGTSTDTLYASPGFAVAMAIAL